MIKYIKEPEGIRLDVYSVPGAERLKAIVDGVRWGIYSPEKNKWFDEHDLVAQARPELHAWVVITLKEHNRRRLEGIAAAKRIGAFVARSRPNFREWEVYRRSGSNWLDIFVDGQLLASYESMEAIHLHQSISPVWLDEARRGGGSLYMKETRLDPNPLGKP